MYSRVLKHGASRASDDGTTSRACALLDPLDLRNVIVNVTTAVNSEIVGQDDAVRLLALAAGLHDGSRFARESRMLIVGSCGASKNSLILALRNALTACQWDMPIFGTHALGITFPGWGGAQPMDDFLDAAPGDAAPDDPRAWHAGAVIRGIPRAGVVDGLHGNLLAKRKEVLSSLFSPLVYGALRPR